MNQLTGITGRDDGYANMQKKSRKNVGKRKGDLELSKKVKQLRESLDVPQTGLAELLRVSRSQIVEWEGCGDERPSVEKFLEMAKLAPTTELRRWFFLSAGLDLDTVRRDFQEEIKLAFSQEQKSDGFRIPIVDVSELLLGKDAAIRKSVKNPSITLDYVPHPTSTICVSCGENPPWATSSDDLVIIDLAAQNLQSLVGRMVGVLVDQFAKESREDRRPSLFQRIAMLPGFESRIGSDRSKAKRECAFAVPALIVGRLEIQFESDADPDIDPNVDTWRLVLRLGLQATKKGMFTLSEWQLLSKSSVASISFESIIRKGYRLIGEVIGWQRDWQS